MAGAWPPTCHSRLPTLLMTPRSLPWYGAISRSIRRSPQASRMKSSAHDSSSFLGSRRSRRASDRRRVSFAHPCTFLGSNVACTRAAFQPPPPPEWPEHVPGGGATVLLSAAQRATFTLAAAAVPVATTVAATTVALAAAAARPVRRLGLHRVCWPAVLLRCAVPHNDHRPL